MKKSLLWLLIMLLTVSMVVTFSLAGCKEEEVAEEEVAEEKVAEEEVAEEEVAEEEVAEAVSFDGVQLKVAMISEPREWQIEELLPEFKEATGIDVTIDFFGFEDLYNKVLTASAGHTGEYDVFQFHFPDMALFDERGYMLDVTDWVMRDKDEMQLDDIHPSLQESHMKYKDRWYGVPTHVGSMTFYYRKDIFENEGYEVPESWEEVLDICRDYEGKNPDIKGFVFMGRADIQGTATYMNILGAYGGDWFDDDFRPLMDQPEWLEALNTELELLEYSVDGSASYGFDEAHVAFEKGKALMIPFWDSGDSFFSNPEESEIIDKWAVAPMPGGRATNGGWSVQISADSPDPEASWEFLKWIVSPEMEAILVPTTPSCRISVLTDPENSVHPSYQGFYNVLSGDPFGFPKITPNWQIMEEAARQINKALTGQGEPEEVLDELQELIEVIVLRYGLWEPTS